MKRAARGFTLLEVLAAIVIMTLAFTMLLKAMGASLALTQKAAARTEVAAMAQSLLDGAYVMSPPQTGVTEGRFDSRHRWRLRVQPWQPPRQGRKRTERKRDSGAQGGPGPGLYKLDLTVMWGAPARQQEAHFVTLRAVDSTHRSGASP